MPFTLRKKPASPAGHGEYKHLGALRLLNVTIIMLLIGGFFSALFFVYHSVYSSIRQVDSIITLQTHLPTEAIDFGKLDRVTAVWEAKHTTTTLFVTRDPFTAIATSTASSL